MVDLLVLGATGFTGKLVTKYLATHPGENSFKLGVAARSKSKLDQLLSDLHLLGVRTFTVDVQDDASVEALLDAAQPKVVLTTVGPFRRLGMSVARLCAKNGVHYVDITGETSFVKSLIQELDDIARQTNAILIPSSGFDSVPSDVLAYLSARTLRSFLNERDVRAPKGVGVAESHTMIKIGALGVSGGSVATFLDTAATTPFKELTNQAPDVLSPVKLRIPQRQKLVHSLPGIRPKRYGNLHLLVHNNVAIVQRTRGLFQQNAKKHYYDDVKHEEVEPAYAEDYMYHESQEASSKVAALLGSFAVMASSTLLAMTPPLRWFVKRMSPAPGQGPSDEVLENGWVEMTNISVSSPLPAKGKAIVVESRMRGRGDPGYALTSLLASEVALALLTPREMLPRLGRQGGVLTPASALGQIILDRLSATGKLEFGSKVHVDSENAISESYGARKCSVQPYF